MSTDSSLVDEVKRPWKSRVFDVESVTVAGESPIEEEKRGVEVET